MRESIGGTWILSIVMTFLMLFTAYLAVSVNYAKAFRIKNNIISKIETTKIDYNTGTSKDIVLCNGCSFRTQLETYLTNQAYVVRGRCSDAGRSVDGHDLKYEGSTGILCDTNDSDLCGVCIFANPALDLDSYGYDKYYYTVVDFFKFDLPLMGDLLTFKVKGSSNAV